MSKRGFASMDPQRQREIASRAGKSVRPENRAFSRDRELAERAGALGGAAAKRRRQEKLGDFLSDATPSSGDV
jgi:general stress protein YciG